MISHILGTVAVIDNSSEHSVTNPEERFRAPKRLKLILSKL